MSGWLTEREREIGVGAPVRGVLLNGLLDRLSPGVGAVEEGNVQRFASGPACDRSAIALKRRGAGVKQYPRLRPVVGDADEG